MFIITAKLSKRKLALGAAALAAVLLAAGAAAGLADDIAALSAQTGVHAAGSAEETDASETVSTMALTDSERIAYLQACGWEVDQNSCVIREVIIPSDFDETYQSYADLQARQGFELEKYKGKRVKQITYNVTNYPDGEEVIAELLVYRGNVIAGDIYSMKTDGGFTRGLMDHPEQTTEGAESTKNTADSDAVQQEK